jgi:hypothetical protein
MFGHEGQSQVYQRHSVVVGETAQRVGSIELCLVGGVGQVVAGRHPLGAAAGRGVRVLAPLARQPATGQRTPHQRAHAVAQRGGEHFGLDAAHQQRVRRLFGDEPLPAALLRHPLGLDDLARGIGRTPDVAHLARADQVGQRTQGLVDVRIGVGAVDLIEVDPVGLQPAQAVLHLADQPAPGVAALVDVLAHRAVRLGGQHHVVSSALERLADDLLGLTGGVHVGGVHEVDSGVQRTVDDGGRIVVIGVSPGAEHHGAQTQRADFHSGGAERAVLHLVSFPLYRLGLGAQPVGVVQIRSVVQRRQRRCSEAPHVGVVGNPRQVGRPARLSQIRGRGRGHPRPWRRAAAPPAARPRRPARGTTPYARRAGAGRRR